MHVKSTRLVFIHIIFMVYFIFTQLMTRREQQFSSSVVVRCINIGMVASHTHTDTHAHAREVHEVCPDF